MADESQAGSCKFCRTDPIADLLSQVLMSIPKEMITVIKLNDLWHVMFFLRLPERLDKAFDLLQASELVLVAVKNKYWPFEGSCFAQ